MTMSLEFYEIDSVRFTYNIVCHGKQFLDFLRENLSKPATSDDVISVRIWLAKQLGTDVDSIGQELEVNI